MQVKIVYRDYAYSQSQWQSERGNLQKALATSEDKSRALKAANNEFAKARSVLEAERAGGGANRHIITSARLHISCYTSAIATAVHEHALGLLVRTSKRRCSLFSRLPSQSTFTARPRTPAQQLLTTHPECPTLNAQPYMHNSHCPTLNAQP